MRDVPFVQESLAQLAALLDAGLPIKAGTGFIVGPSHSVRWHHAIENGALPKPYEVTRIIGRGGFPVWNRTLFGNIFRHHRTGTPMFLIAPDFRFGNLLYKQNRFVLGQFYDDYSHVEKALIRPEVDAVLYRQHVENLTIWRSVFGRDLKIFEWTLLMTASEHRWQNRYVGADGTYENRAYAEWVSCDRFRLGALSWPEALLADDNARLRRLMVDRSLHPSAIGYFFLHYMVHGEGFTTALEKAEGLWLQWCKLLADRIAVRTQQSRPLTIYGDGDWIETMQRLLGGEELEMLRKAGLSLPGLSEKPGIAPQNAPADSVHVQLTDAIDIPDYGQGSASRPYRVSWGTFARNTLVARHQAHAHLAVPNIEALKVKTPKMALGQIWLADALHWASPEMFMEAGGSNAPNFVGVASTLLSLVDLIAENHP